ERGDSAAVNGIGCWHRTLPVELVRRDRLGLAGGRRRLAVAPRFTAQARLGEQAPDPAAAALEPRLRQPRPDPTRAVGATPLRNRALPCVLPLRIGSSVSARLASKPRVGAAARDVSDPTYTPDGERRVLLLHPGVLHGSGWAKDAAAFLQI